MSRSAESSGRAASAGELPQSAANMHRLARRFDLALFTQELLSLLEAGLNLTECLETLGAKSARAAAAEAAVIDHLLHRIRQGQPLSSSMADLPDVFPVIYVSTVRSGERTGSLAPVLKRYLDYQQQFDAMRRKLVAASVYPALLLAIGSLVVLFLIGFVVPRFASVYESAGRDLPVLSRAMLAIGGAIHSNPGASALFLGAALCGLAFAARSSRVRTAMLANLERVPVFSAHAALYRQARFYRAMGMLLSAGIALPEALGMTGALLGASQTHAALRVRRRVEEGVTLSSALQENGLSSAVAQSLIRVGERSGQLSGMLERVAQFHDEELSRGLEWLSRLLEPVLMLAIGLVIGTVVVLMYLPILDLAGGL